MTFKEISPFVIVVTLIVSILIAKKIKKKDIITIDGIFSIMGFGLGLVITFVNLIYSNNYLIALGPILSIASVSYLRFRKKIIINENNFCLNSRMLKVVNILYWISISSTLVIYQQVSIYRPQIFFIDISFGVAVLGLETIWSRFKNSLEVFGVIFKILLISLILIASAYFISPYPVGNDPWGHADFINDIFRFGTKNVPPAKDIYYTNYPLMHIYAVSINLIDNINTKDSMFIIGVILVLSTIFIYIIVKNMTGNINLSLLSMLMINFADFHIQWSVQIIAMSFGIAIYTILLYLIMTGNEKHKVLNKSFLIFFLFIITWTHTVAGFIALISILSLYVGSLLYILIYKKRNEQYMVSFTLCTLFLVLLLYHWSQPNYNFLGSIAVGLNNSITTEANFLGRSETISIITIITDDWGNMFNIIGFLIYIFFGIIGILYYLSKEFASQTKFSAIFMIVILFFIFLVFPVFGMRNIMPYRWPGFIYVSFVLFTAIGLMKFLCVLKSKYLIVIYFLVLFVSSFFMITNFSADTDSPIYGKVINQKLAWTESEIKLFENVNKSYDGTIVTDSDSVGGPFQSYLKKDAVDFQLTIEGDMNWKYMNDKLIVWREISLTRHIRPIEVNQKDKNRLDSTFSNIYDTGDAKAYLKILS